MIRALLLFAVGFAALACTTAASDPAVASVEISVFEFRPATVEVPVGATVAWRNLDEALHTATSGVAAKVDRLGTYRKATDGFFHGAMDGSGTSFEVTFDRPGRFPYFCDRHPHMTGTVIVTASSRIDGHGPHEIPGSAAH